MPSTNDLSQMNLKEPAQVDWEAPTGSSYQAPPPAAGPDGKAIVYYGVAAEIKETDPDDGYLNVLLDPIKVVRNGTYDGYQIRFTRCSTKPFMKKDAEGVLQPMKGNPNRLANFLRSTGVAGKPQQNSEYRSSIKAVTGRPFPFTIDWEAYNKDTGERLKGYQNFPDDPERPGQKKSILKKGDIAILRDNKGNQTGTMVVESEVLFANARLRYFQDAAPKAGR